MVATEVWGSTEFISAIVGAVVGTLGGGLISFGLQMWSTRSERRVALQDRRERETAIARALLLKLTYLHSDVSRIKDHLENGLALHPELPSSHVWGSVRPLANIPHTLASITADEVALLIPLRDADVMNNVISAERMRDAVVDLMQNYSNLRKTLSAKLQKSPPRPDGRADIATKDLNEFAGEMYELDKLIFDTVALAREYEGDLNSALHGSHKLLSQKYDLGFTLGTEKRRILE